MQPLVSVIVLTYNQEDSISYTLESILKQKTDFNYEIVIGDDLSTDKTREIINTYKEKYPMIIKPIFNEKNLGILNNYISTLVKCKGKYIAECAGDDYWCYEYKLQEQVNILEQNENIGLVYTDYIVNSVNTNERYIKETSNPEKNIFDQLLIGNFISAPTVCFRTSLLKYIDFDEYVKNNFIMEDYPMWLEFSQHTKFYRIPKVTVVYKIDRINNDNPRNIALHACRFDENSTKIRLYFLDKYKENTELTKQNILNAHYFLCFKQGLNINDREFTQKYLKLLSYHNIYTFVLRIICKFDYLFYLYQKYRSLKHIKRTNLQIYFGQ